MTTGLGNEVQARAIADQVALAAVERYAQLHPPKPELPAIIKWIAGFFGTLATFALIGMCGWVVTTLSSLQQTVTRIDTRQQVTDGNIEGRLKQIEDRITRVEMERKDRGA